MLESVAATPAIASPCELTTPTIRGHQGPALMDGGILLPQAPETAIAHVAAYKAGLIAVPLFTLFGEDALEFRLADSGAKALVTDGVGLAKLSVEYYRSGCGPRAAELVRDLPAKSNAGKQRAGRGHAPPAWPAASN